jgi:hypothetical protein
VDVERFDGHRVVLARRRSGGEPMQVTHEFPIEAER